MGEKWEKLQKVKAFETKAKQQESGSAHPLTLHYHENIIIFCLKKQQQQGVSCYC